MSRRRNTATLPPITPPCAHRVTETITEERFEGLFADVPIERYALEVCTACRQAVGGWSAQ